MRSLRTVSPAFLLVSTMLAGCGGHSGGSSGGNGGGGGSVAQSNVFKLNANVVELDKTSTVVVSVADGSVVLTGAPALAAGQILIHNAADETRFLRKVVSATVVGGTTTVTTTDAAATDVFASANIVQDAYISSADLLKLQPAQEGVTFTSAESKARPMSRADIPKININFAKFQIKDDSGSVIADVDGTVTLAAGLETIWKQKAFNPLPYEAGVAGIASVSGKLTAHARASGTFSKEVPVSLSLPVPITPLGPLGVNLNLQMLVKVEGTYTADGQFVLTAGIDTKEGVHYDSTNHWTFANDFHKTLNFTPPNLRGSIEFGVSMIRPSVTADILGMGKAYVKADVMKAVAKISGQSTPVPGFLVEGFGDFGFTAGGSLYIGPWKIWQDERSYDIGKFSIVTPFLLKTLGATESQIAYLEPTRTKLHAVNGDGTADRVLFTAPVAAFAPDVSNANKKICFVSYDKGTYAATLTTVTPDGKTVATIPVPGLNVDHPAWSPAGTEIAFDAADPKGVRQIYVINLATSKIRKLTSEVTGGGATKPAWSADGTKIFYVRYSNSVTNISVTSSASETYDVVLANDSRNYSDPSLSPTSNLLVCVRSDAGIVVSDDNGRNEHTIVASTSLSHPRWSPDGTRIVVQDDSASKLVSFDLNGGDRKTLGSGTSPSWGLR